MAQFLDDTSRRWMVDVQRELHSPATVLSTLADWGANGWDAE
jgi:hypothetical protein